LKRRWDNLCLTLSGTRNSARPRICPRSSGRRSAIGAEDTITHNQSSAIPKSYPSTTTFNPISFADLPGRLSPTSCSSMHSHVFSAYNPKASFWCWLFPFVARRYSGNRFFFLSCRYLDVSGSLRQPLLTYVSVNSNTL